MSSVDDWIDSIVRDVAELPDRDVPEGKPHMMIVSHTELRDIIEDRCIEIGLQIE